VSDRFLMISSIFEKLSYIVGNAALLLSGRIAASQAVSALPVLFLTALFIASFY
jgi:hypothetical protein